MNRRGLFGILCGMFAAVGIGKEAEARPRTIRNVTIRVNVVPVAVHPVGTWVAVDELVYRPRSEVTTIRRGLFGGTIIRTKVR